MSAGYVVYSLDWDKFQQFINKPTKSQLLAFSNLISDGLDEYDDEFEEDDPVQEWPSEPEALTGLVKRRLKQPDWYGDLSKEGKDIWEAAVNDFCDDVGKKGLGFRVEGVRVYWDVIEIARRHHRLGRNQITESALSHFGTRPFRYHPPSGRVRYSHRSWTPNHSMHTPDEVKQLLEELKAAGPSIAKAMHADALRDYEDELMPALEKIARKGRMLYIAVDT